MQRSESFRIRHIDVGPELHQRPHRVHMSIDCRCMQQSVSPLILQSAVGPELDQRPELFHSPVQRCRPQMTSQDTHLCCVHTHVPPNAPRPPVSRLLFALHHFPGRILQLQ
eukprot:1181967-Prorocentrum_minimum.AAC.1